MKKKIVALLLVSLLLVSLVAGCQGNGPETTVTTTTTGSPTESTTETTQPQEPVELVVQFLFTSDFGEGFYRMEDALNEILVKDVGVHVTFERTDLMTSASDATLMLSAGEQLDICVSFAGTHTSLLNSNLIIPLDDLYAQYGQDILEQGKVAADMCRINGKLYGVTVMAAGGTGTGYNMKKSFADKYQLKPDAKKLYTLADMNAIFDSISAGEGGNTLMFVPWMNTSEPLNYNLTIYDRLGGDLAWGVLMLDRTAADRTKVVNFFETPEYAAGVQQIYEWAKKGYISADAAVTSDLPDDICKRDNVIGTYSYGAPDPRLNQKVNWADEVVVFNTTPPTVTGGTAGLMWHITTSCENPEKAMQYLNYFYKNNDAYVLVQYGFEGEEYEVVKTEGNNKQVKWLAANPGDLPYFNTYPALGNMLRLPVFEPNPINSNEILLEIANSIPDSRKSPAIGYAFDSSTVTAELAAIRAVIAQYAPSLNAGAVNPAEALPEFISELKAAGMDKVIVENQKQLDTFLQK